MAILKDAQQGHLSFGRQAIDFLEEERTLFCLGDGSRPLEPDIGEGAWLVAEKLIFQERLGQRALACGSAGLRRRGAASNRCVPRQAPP